MTSISTILKFWVISVAILEITGRRGKAKKKHPKRQSSPTRAVQCPTKCHRFIDKYNSQLVREVKPGQFLVETRVATHCDTDCFEDCLKTQDPQNTQVVSYTCAAKSSVCDYRENKECEKHVFNSDGEPLPWPNIEDDQAEEEQVEPEISEYSDDNCPVCMDSDLSDKMVGCMKNRYKTESCVAGDSCWVYDLSGSLSVNLLNGDQIVLDKVIKCQRDTLPHQGCNNAKCTGNFRPVHEEIGRSNNDVYTTTPIQRVKTNKVQTTQPATEPVISTEQERDENPATESQDNNSIEKSSTETIVPVITVKSEPSVDSKEEISVKPATESNEETTVKQTTEPKLEGVANLTTAKDAAKNPTTEPKRDTEILTTAKDADENLATELNHISFGTTPTQPGPGPDDLKINPDEDDNLTVDDREVDENETAVVCSEEVHNCPDGQECFGRKMGGGNIDYVCSQDEPDCTGDDGCTGTCMPEHYDPCVSTSPTRPTEPGEVTEKPPHEDNLSESSGDDETNNVESLPNEGGLETNESNETETDRNEIDPNEDEDEVLAPIIEEVSKTMENRGESTKISIISLWLIASFLLLRHPA